MLTSTTESAIAPPLQSLIDLFASELAQVKFPDVDLAVLNEAAAKVREKAEAVARAEAALDVARAALADSQEALLAKGHRALAYARVYAEEDEALSAKLEAVGLPRPPRRLVRAELHAEVTPLVESAPRRRGRPPKAKPSAPLFSEESPAEPEVAAG